MIVLLDTNFITLPEQFHIDIFAKIREIIPNAEFTTLSQVVDELKSLKNKPADIGLEIIKKENVKIIDTKGKADELLLETALKNKAVIATNDKELKQKAIAKKIKVIFMRGKQNLQITGGEMFV